MGLNGMQVPYETIKDNIINEIKESILRLEVYYEQPNTGEVIINQDLQGKLDKLSVENLKDILIRISKIQECCSGDITMGESQDTSYEHYISKLNISRRNLEASVKGGLSSIKTTLKSSNFESLNNQSLTSISTGLKEIIHIINTPDIKKDNNTQEQPQ